MKKRITPQPQIVIMHLPIRQHSPRRTPFSELRIQDGLTRQLLIDDLPAITPLRHIVPS